MFTNMGAKIKSLAVIICWIGIAVSVICGFILAVAVSEETEGVYPLFMFSVVSLIGFLASWVGSFLLYGYGDLIENTAYIADRFREEEMDE